jgi:hypothetical protein
MNATIRVSAKSLPILAQIHRHVEMCNVRGDLQRFRDVASDSCDGHFYRDELDDLVKRRLLTVIRYDDNDPAGRFDRRLCGSTWSVDPTERLVRGLWPDRLSTPQPNVEEGDGK